MEQTEHTNGTNETYKYNIQMEQTKHTNGTYTQNIQMEQTEHTNGTNRTYKWNKRNIQI
jgi:hypothetical protein